MHGGSCALSYQLEAPKAGEADGLLVDDGRHQVAQKDLSDGSYVTHNFPELEGYFPIQLGLQFHHLAVG